MSKSVGDVSGSGVGAVGYGELRKGGVEKDSGFVGSAGSIGKKGPPPALPPKKGAAQQQQDNDSKGVFATALYDFVGDRSTDLNFKKGDRIQVLSSGATTDWWRGVVGGREGDFPGEFWVWVVLWLFTVLISIVRL